MPKIARYSLVWSPLQQAYELHESPYNGVRDIISESPDWLEWLSQISSFAFHGRNGSYSAWKEHKQRGEGYWYASAKSGGKLNKRYLGRDIDLTLHRLEEVAQVLRLNTPDIHLEKEDFCSVTRQQGDIPTHQKTRLTLAQQPTNALLVTKLHLPRPRSHLVHRPRLMQRLEQGRERALTLISAPIGFGKSTLLSDWLASSTNPVAWLSLDPQDNEPARFLSYLIAALQIYDPQLVASRQVQNIPFQPVMMEDLLTLLINDLLMRRTEMEEKIILVLDNYQVIKDQSIHQALSFLLDQLSPQMQLILATREDPPLPLAHLRGRDDLVELRASDLRFTQEEAHTFLKEVMALSLTKEESALLQARTEGWITGLQLAAFSLQGHTDPGAFITAFGGSNHYVVDYLLEEVLNHQSEVIQDFLLQTSILDRLSAPLCDAVRGQKGSQTLLDSVERANLFLVALDDERHWYRYHRLFAEALCQRLQQTNPTLVPTLHERARGWYERKRWLDGAVSHVLPAHVSQSSPMIEPLTEREREVLQLLLAGASNQEIARDLVLSINTVKKHVYNICRKLDVRSRAQAIVKARLLHLP